MSPIEPGHLRNAVRYRCAARPVIPEALASDPSTLSPRRPRTSIPRLPLPAPAGQAGHTPVADGVWAALGEEREPAVPGVFGSLAHPRPRSSPPLRQPAVRQGDGHVGHTRCRRRARRARARSGSSQAWSAPGACRDHTHRRNVRRTGRTRRRGSSWPCGPCGPRAASDYMAVAAATRFQKVAEFDAGCGFRPYHDIAHTAQRPRERLLPVVPMVVPAGESCVCAGYARVELRVAWCRLPQPERCV